MRVWGWLPRNNPVYTTVWTRDRILQTIHDELIANGTIVVWREMNSTRDPATKTDPLAFLKGLLSLH